MMETVSMTRAELARMIDHTLLEPEVTDADVSRLCQEAGLLGVHSVCISRAAVGPRVVLKVIIEAAAIGPARIEPACRAAESGGADFVKTSTGFHPAGGATVAAVRAMAAVVGGRLGVKAAEASERV